MNIGERRAALLFDLDGTMVDTAPDLAAALGATLREFGVAPLALPVVTGFIGQGVRHLVRRAWDSTALAARVDFERALLRFEHHYATANGRHSRVYPGVLDGLREVRRLGFRTACVTNKPHALAAALLASTGLATHLDVLVAGDTLATMKPSPEPLWHACALLNAGCERCVLIGDSSIDIAAARAARIKVVIVSYGYGGGIQPTACDALIASFEALPTLLVSSFPTALDQ